jgi:hypothetical protein
MGTVMYIVQIRGWGEKKKEREKKKEERGKRRVEKGERKEERRERGERKEKRGKGFVGKRREERG